MGMGATTTMEGSNDANVPMEVQLFVLLLLMGSTEQVLRRRLGLGSMYYFYECGITMSPIMYVSWAP